MDRYLELLEMARDGDGGRLTMKSPPGRQSEDASICIGLCDRGYMRTGEAWFDMAINRTVQEFVITPAGRTFLADSLKAQGLS